MTKRSSPGATAWSLFLAFFGAIVVVFIVDTVGTAVQTPYLGAFSTFVVLPLIGSIFVVPFCLIVTLLAWACFVLAHRWVHNSQVWTGVVSVALTVASCSTFYLVVVLFLPTLREPRQLLAFFLALAMVLTICVVRGVGRPWEAAFSPA